MEIEYYEEEPKREPGCSCWIGLRDFTFKWMKRLVRKKYRRITHINCLIHNGLMGDDERLKLMQEELIQSRVLNRNW